MACMSKTHRFRLDMYIQERNPGCREIERWTISFFLSLQRFIPVAIKQCLKLRAAEKESKPIRARRLKVS